MKGAIIGSLLGLTSTALAASKVNKQCQGGICYSMSIPDATGSSSSGTVFYQITGPTSNSWIGMGSGSQMAGSKMFIVYTAANGQNVTLSPRSASGHVMPSPDSSIKATLLDGSGVKDGQMTANIRCDNCDTSGAHIFGARSGSALNTDSQSASIQQHSGTYGTFSFDTAAAKGGSDANPFAVGAATTTSGSGSSGSSSSSGSNCAASAAGAQAGAASGTAASGRRPPWATGTARPSAGGWRNFIGTDGDDLLEKRQSADDCSSGDSSSSFSNAGAGGNFGGTRTKLIAHGVMAGLAFAVLFPFGAISIRLFSFPGLVWFHAGLQIIAQLIFIIAFALGVGLAQDLRLMNNYHPIIGIVIFVLVCIQPFLGFLHHRAFKRVGHRTGWSHGHLWLGRIIITLGIINGGLGFKLAGNTNTGPIVYAVVAGLFFLVYVVAVIIGERRRARSVPPKNEVNDSPRSFGSAAREMQPQRRGPPPRY